MDKISRISPRTIKVDSRSTINDQIKRFKINQHMRVDVNFPLGASFLFLLLLFFCKQNKTGVQCAADHPAGSLPRREKMGSESLPSINADWFCCIICRRNSSGESYWVSDCGHITCYNCYKSAGEWYM